MNILIQGIIFCVACLALLVLNKKRKFPLSMVKILFCVFAVSSIISYFVVPKFTTTYDEIPVTITAMNKANSMAEGNEIFIKDINIDGKTYTANHVVSGKWITSNDRLGWRTYNQPSNLTNSIELFIPEGSHREILFESNKWRGIAEISYGDTTSEVDCYASTQGDSTCKVSLAPSNFSTLIQVYALNIFVSCLFLLLFSGIGLMVFKHIKQIKKYQKGLNLLLIIIISSVFLFVFSYSTSPLYSKFTMWCFDSPYYMVLGRCVLAGKVPYRDIFEQKGPYIFFIEALGQWISYGRLGTFILQCIFLSVTLYFLTKIAKIFLKKNTNIWIVTLLFLLLFVFTMQEGNLTEEYSLPFIFASVYIGLKNYIMSDHTLHNKWFAVIYGACFGFLVFLRITNVVAIGCMVLSIFISLIYNKQWKNILYNALCFILGIGIAVMPIVIYFLKNNALYDMIYGTFIVPYKYAVGEKDLKTVLQFAFVTGTILAAFLLAATIYYLKTRNKRLLVFSGISFLFTLPALSLGYGYPHYQTINLINVVLVFCIVLNLIVENRLTVKKQQILAIITIFCMIFPYVFLPNYSYNVDKFQTLKSLYSLRNVSDSVEVRVASSIPKSELSESFVYGMSDPNWCLLNETLPRYRYMSPQGVEWFKSFDVKIYDDYNKSFLRNPPKWFIIEKNTEISNEELKKEINANYIFNHEQKDVEGGTYLYYRIKTK